ncbi:polyprenyl synthetase family protein [Flavisolibacter ginsengisoli]|jgi:octaprenyl-diphosphate synthase|uniref:Octaprenyl-diphosphate synthase n=1 Tax=Flavisolibacter ginsengisoli DSM 18119 TaxID=1121884 RepID=A0A1M5FBK9_9BACT|nr:polyprenyl synthetase family protein [Flavisolibacter ginsengisoli]SHF88829.1 octaprenyl-diphosphate synthase [Flavisolibacter ginsengisoli DSM 18119]
MQLPVNLIENELRIFEEKFKDAAKSNVSMLDRIMRYIVKRKGKQLRPMFVFLSAKLCGEVNESTYRAASLVELLHTATLVHDDVVDDSLERRGFFSVYALWKNKVSVLVGDYLLAKGLLLSLDNNDFRILQLLSEAVRQMSEGELLQIEKSRSLNLDESIYFEIIRNKTASLLASACGAGAFSTSHDEEITSRLRQFGEKVGIAFQIKDDLFDYAGEDIGKPTGNDIKEKKLTLPLIYTLNNVDKKTKKELIYIIKNENTKRPRIDYLINVVTKTGGIDYTINKMNQYKSEALQILNTFPDSEIRKGFEDLVNFVTDRKY